MKYKPFPGRIVYKQKITKKDDAKKEKPENNRFLPDRAAAVGYAGQ